MFKEKTERKTFLRNLVTHFNTKDLKELCFALSIDYKNLALLSKSSQVREILSICESNNKLEELIHLCQQLKPNISWPTITTQSNVLNNSQESFSKLQHNVAFFFAVMVSVISIIWLAVEPGFEPLISVLTTIGGLVVIMQVKQIYSFRLYIVFLVVLVFGFLIFLNHSRNNLSRENSNEEDILTLPAIVLPPQNGIMGSSWLRPRDKMSMVFVPNGTFTMGNQFEEDKQDNSDHERDEFPVRNITLNSFWLDETEITNEMYTAFLNDRTVTSLNHTDLISLNSDAAKIRRSPSGQYGTVPTYELHPVVSVSWFGANEYCKWVGGRLPTEAEWEYAAKGPNGYRYPWGNIFDNSALNYCAANCGAEYRDASIDDGYRETAPVKSYPKGISWISAHDMSGNVWEWVNDWYGEYNEDERVNPIGPISGEFKVVRGGAFDTWALLNETFNRWRELPHAYFSNIGFRCAINNY